MYILNGNFYLLVFNNKYLQNYCFHQWTYVRKFGLWYPKCVLLWVIKLNIITGLPRKNSIITRHDDPTL